MRKIGAFILSILFICTTTSCGLNKSAVALETTPSISIESTEPLENIFMTPELSSFNYETIFKDWEPKTYEYVENLTKEENLIAQQDIEEYLATFFSLLREIPDEYREGAIQYTGFNIDEIEKVYTKYCQDYMDILQLEKEEAKKWELRMEEYPTATIVWKHLTEVMGCNNYVAAGIIGNMMAECGGQTLKLDWSARNATGHYGLCQWSPGFSTVQGADLQGQLNFMIESFPAQIDRWGDICYKKDFGYKEFMAMEDAEEAAYAFCVIYERPGPGTYSQRRANALKALEYFTN